MTETQNTYQRITRPGDAAITRRIEEADAAYWSAYNAFAPADELERLSDALIDAQQAER